MTSCGDDYCEHCDPDGDGKCPAKDPMPACPAWIEQMITAMVAHVHAGCDADEAARIGGHVGAVAATLFYSLPTQGHSNG